MELEPATPDDAECPGCGVAPLAVHEPGCSWAAEQERQMDDPIAWVEAEPQEPQLYFSWWWNDEYF